MKYKDNQMVEKKENFLNRIKTLIRKIFKKEDINNIEEKVENDYKIQRENEFIRTLKIKENPEEERLLKLQKAFREGKITQGDLSDEDIEKLGKLYDKQIERLKIQIEECKKRIEDKKKKLQKT